MSSGGPAFPKPDDGLLGQVHNAQVGMTLRDYFAAKVMQGMCAVGNTWVNEHDGDVISKRAYAIADSMLAERERLDK